MVRNQYFHVYKYTSRLFKGFGLSSGWPLKKGYTIDEVSISIVFTINSNSQKLK